MRDRAGHLIAQYRTCVATANAALLLLMIAAGAAWPQAAPPASSPPSSLGIQAPAQQVAPDRAAPQQSEPLPQEREERPGLINEMGKLFEKSLSILPSLKSPSETIDGLNTRAKDAAKDASDSLSRLAKPSSMVSGRMMCPVSTNGAPDCKAGADRLCRAKGFQEGNSLNTDSAETCSPKVFIPGRVRKPDDCRTDNYVTRAVCQ
jgi:hypothetical protein